MKTLILFLLINSYLISAPAFTKIREFKSADGTIFMAKAQGNQSLNWIETEDGEILKYNSKSKNYEYAKIKKSRLVLSGTMYEKNNSNRARSIGHVNMVTRSELSQLVQENRHKHNRINRY